MMSATPGITVAPSLLAADFSRLGEEVRAVEAAGADWLHLDVMDGHFVPNISFGPALIRGLRKHTAMPFDAHLMIAPCDPYLAAFAEAGCNHISIHPEAGPHLHRSLQAIRALGCKTGVVLNPSTPVEHVAWVLELCDIVTVMTVNPGFGGQAFIEGQLAKVAEVRAMVAGRPIAIEVDGGISPETAPRAVAAGAGVLVAGTAVFAAKDYRMAMDGMRGAA